MLRYLPLLAITLPALGAELTCTGPGSNIYPRDTVYSGTAGTNQSSWSGSVRPAVQLYTTPPQTYCTPANCTILEITFTDPHGTIYAAPVYNATVGMGVWSSPTPIPSYSSARYSVTGTVRYRHTPADGSTLVGPGTTTADLRLTTANDTALLGNTYTMGTTNSTAIAGTTASYQPPNQHDFGDIPPNSTGNRLVLPAPSSGSLAAEILWSGPSGTSMTRRIGSAGPLNVPPGSTYQLDTAGNGLELDLKASDTASPGEISGNLTLTLTCP